ncbi:hypothetical protein L207DRAFT_505652 [Hyaloscypha variabilis F]|uniref:PAH2 domain-containing protein n=1 Tax=Hyaloscypha variabilis (strain UAMH 11265 / GT02V1 / F) TaxID=1149755 RepID=A0A2J6SCY7_HYAVF|nr:hypothetical protein L207DRAFT_505652 [Hyaloscypha variabilis F]
MTEEAPACRADPGAMPRAMAYISEVQKRLFPERDEEYQHFIKLFSDYIGGKSLEQMQAEMKTLFKDEPDLVKGFEEFLPVPAPKATEDKGGELGDAAI